MEYQRTVKIPVHYKTTKRKLSYLDNLTRKLTFAVRVWNKIIEKHDLETKSDCSPYESKVQKVTNLSSTFVQQARDKALWAWKQYAEEHEKWEWKLEKAKESSKWYNKLKEGEPSKPFTSKRSKLKKIPTRFDKRTGKLEKAKDTKLSSYVIKISTLKKYEKVIILLNPSKYHKKKLEKAEKICSFEIVKHPERKCKWMVHVTCKYHTPTKTVESLRGVDLGVEREVASVKLSKAPKSFSLVKTDKLERLKELNDRIAHLKRKEEWEALKKLRNKRKNVAKDYDRKMAKKFEEEVEKEIVVVGNPKNIRYHKFKGNGNKAGRKILQHWTFARQGNLIVQKCMEKGIIAVRFNEWNTSNSCYKCGGKLKEKGRRVKCKNCGLEQDREFNSCVRILQKASSYLKDKSSEALKKD